VLLVGRQAGGEIQLTRRAITLGRDRKNAIVIPDPYVSRQHARIVWRNGQYFLEPLGSRNGTFVDDHLVIKPRRLKFGQRIRVAHISVCVFEGPTRQVAQTR